MKTIHRIFLLPILSGASVLVFSTIASGAVKPTEVSAPALPDIWQKAGPRERLKATRAAEVDADRLLAERIYGLQVDSETTIQDIVAGDDKIAGALTATLVGAMTTEQPSYLPDGQVQVVRAVKIREIIETLNHVVKGKRLDDGSLQTTSDNTKTNREVKDKVIDAMGNSALPNSEGHQKIMAKRAAEIDACRRLAARIMGQKISGNTTIRDMCLENDHAMASLSRVIKGATPTNIKYFDDGSCEVTMEITMSDLVRTTRRYMKNGTQKTEIKDDLLEKSFSETGRGTMQPVAIAAPIENSPLNQPQGDTVPSPVSAPKNLAQDPFFETEMILKQVIQSEPVVR
jgi:hypothetical protein